MPNFPVLPATLPFTLGLANELTWFLVQGAYTDVENPSGLGTTFQPSLGVVNGTVTFFPRVPTGTTLFIPDLDDGRGYALNTAVPLAPIQGRILNGILETINRANTVGVELLANTSIIQTALANLGLSTTLVYDVQFSNVAFANKPQVINNFAFVAPTTSTTIVLSDPALTKIAYQGPNTPYTL